MSLLLCGAALGWHATRHPVESEALNFFQPVWGVAAKATQGYLEALKSQPAQLLTATLQGNDIPEHLPPLRSVSLDRSGPSALTVVALQPDRRALMVDATVNNRLQGRFIVDTGATYTSITPEMADSLDLNWRNGEKVLITTANGRIEVPKVVLHRVRLNGVEARDVEATVIDVRKGASFSGLLGLSFTNQFLLTIDPERGQLIFQPLRNP
jgi:clan AA aspartic protease (TIGR02281 family)